MKRYIATLLLGVSALATHAYAQESFGQVLGTVTDPTGAAIPAANLVLSGPRVPKGLTTNSGADGTYLFAAVPIRASSELFAMLAAPPSSALFRAFFARCFCPFFTFLCC